MDEELVVRAQKGDRRAFETLVVADYARLFRLAHSILRDRSQAEDATQQAYFDIWRNIRRLRDPVRFEAWTYRILVNACHREAKRTPRWLPEDVIPEALVPRAADAYATVLDQDEIHVGFRRLTVDQRAVIVLHYLLDMTLEQVAEALGVPKGTVDSRLHRALESMRRSLAAERQPTSLGVRTETVR